MFLIHLLACPCGSIIKGHRRAVLYIEKVNYQLELPGDTKSYELLINSLHDNNRAFNTEIVRRQSIYVPLLYRDRFSKWFDNAEI